jgi:hypothetical protein
MVCERALIRGDSIGAVLSGLFVACCLGFGKPIMHYDWPVF